MFRILVGVSLLLGTVTARADDDPKKAAPTKAVGKAGKVDRAKLFDTIDTNKDGKITKEEYKAFLDAAKKKAEEKGKGGKAAGKAVEMMEKVFEKMDANKDGVVSKEEFEKFDPKTAGKGKKGK
jgi:polyhydroxyalkanoate synthesis regulator phasin